MKKQITILPVCMAALLLPASADTFFMKDGTQINGTILRKDATSYVVEVQVTKSIKDERTLAKEDVLKIEIERPDLAIFKNLSKLIPVPDLMPATEYDARIQQVEKFTIEHRDSAKLKEAKAILAQLKGEAGQITAGGIKMNGKIIPPEEYRANMYEIDARIQEVRIRSLVANSQAFNALRVFSELERDFRNTGSYTAILPLVIRVINSYLSEVGQLQATYDARIKERQLGLERMAASDRASTEAAINEENAACELRFKREKDGKTGWVTIHPLHKPSLDETLAFGKQELNRLGTSGKETQVDGGKLFRDSFSLIRSGGAAPAVAASISAAEAAKVAPRYLAILKSAAQNSATKP